MRLQNTINCHLLIFDRSKKEQYITLYIQNGIALPIGDVIDGHNGGVYTIIEIHSQRSSAITGFDWTDVKAIRS